MALDINGASFDAFVEFARAQEKTGKQKAVARFDASELGGIAKRTITPGAGDWVGIGAGRLSSLKKANNITRDAFRKAVGDMFGGENHIPESVLKAMKLEDYGKGKPLTARRILAVKAAIDEVKLNVFSSADSENVAKTRGWTAAEMPKLARAAHLLSAITGEDELTSIERLSRPGTKEFRLMNYGGRFLKSPDSFRNGLELIDTFGKWFDQTSAALDGLRTANPKYEKGMSRTLLNADTSTFDKDEKLGFERFAFEEIAYNPSFNLAERDGNALFGMENNAAASCIGRKFCHGMMQTLAQIPPEKRTLFFKALTTFAPLYASTADQAKVELSERHNIASSKSAYVASRILKNFERVAGLADAGKLNAANLVKLCFPEIKRPGNDPVGAVVDLIDGWITDMYGGEFDFDAGEQVPPPKYSANDAGLMVDMMIATGCTIEEAASAVKGGGAPPRVPYYSQGSLGLRGLDGSTTKARSDLLGDIVRPSDYTLASDPKKGLLGEGCGFTFNLPGGKSLVTNSSAQGKANAQAVLDELEALCGKNHPRQAANLMMMTSQSGLSSLKGGLAIYGVGSDEHVAVDFTLAKNEETGDVTIRYSSPRGLPFSFEWTATVRPDGYVSATPMQFSLNELFDVKVLDAGYHKSELPMLANAFKLIKSATGCGDAEAIEKTLDPTSRERRLFGYGGRFIASAEAFKQGLDLMDKFGGWYKNVVDTVKKNKDNLGVVPDPTIRNAYSSYLGHDMLKAYEKFLFEEIAVNDSLPLGADNLDAVFGMEANAAMRFVGRGYTNSINDSVAKMPVEVRQVLFAAFDAMVPLAADEAGLRENPSSTGVTIPVARIMRHLDGLREMQKAGNLTALNVKTLLFPDVPDAGTKPLKTIIGEIERKTTTKHMHDPGAIMRIYSMVQSSGCTCDEVIAAYNEGRVLPRAPYILSGTGRLEDLDGTARGARTQAVGDLIRPSNPESIQNGAKMLPREGKVFTVRFPDGAVLTAGASDNDADNAKPANAIADKVTEFVGVKHQAQLASVMIGLTQSAHGPFLDNSEKLGFINKIGAEHSALTYTFSRNDETGAVTIRYSEPQGFPKKFHWETTIALDGSAVTTPLVVEE